jgi:hypothetical protein
LIEVLDRYEVEYLIVGGAAAYAYGARRPTEDADRVVRRGRANLDWLASALREMHGRLRVGGMTDAGSIDDGLCQAAQALQVGLYELERGSGILDGHCFVAYRKRILRDGLQRRRVGMRCRSVD